jgi:excisionase family DNA binding protein
MTRQPSRRHGPGPGSAGPSRPVPGPAPPEDNDGAAAAASGAGADQPGGRLAYSVGEAARLTGLSRDLLYDEMRRGNLTYLKVGRRRLITRHHLQQFLGDTSS